MIAMQRQTEMSIFSIRGIVRYPLWRRFVIKDILLKKVTNSNLYQTRLSRGGEAGPRQLFLYV